MIQINTELEKCGETMDLVLEEGLTGISQVNVANIWLNMMRMHISQKNCHSLSSGKGASVIPNVRQSVGWLVCPWNFFQHLLSLKNKHSKSEGLCAIGKIQDYITSNKQLRKSICYINQEPVLMTVKLILEIYTRIS